MAEFVENHRVISLRRVVKTPARWDRIVEVAASYNFQLPEIADRYAGYSDALAEFALPVEEALQVDVPFEMSRAHATIREFLEKESDIDGVVCASDVMALSAIATFGEVIASHLASLGAKVALHGTSPTSTRAFGGSSRSRNAP